MRFLLKMIVRKQKISHNRKGVIMDYSALEYEDEREKEKIMNVEIAGLKIEIPETLVEERQKYLYFDSLEENMEDMKNTGYCFLGCFKPGEIKNDLDFQEKFISHLESELDLYR